MQANKQLIVHKPINANVSYLKLIHNYECIYVYEFSLDIDTASKKICQDLQLSCEKYLDRFLIVQPSCMTKICEFWHDFFDFFFSEYEDIIDIENNKQNISFLFDTICANATIHKNSEILDFACGTGLSVYVVKNVKLTGVDISDKMLNVASSRGLQTICFNILKERYNYYDGIFSSYAFHLCTDNETLSAVWNALKTDAPLVVNFYKGLGVQAVNNFVQERGGTIIEITNQHPNKKNNVSYLYIKNSLFFSYDEAKALYKSNSKLPSEYF